MSRWYHSACPNKNCGSSDAFSWKDGDEFGHCFSCGKSSRIGEKEESNKVSKTSEAKKIPVEEINEYPVRGFKERGITKYVTEHFGAHCGYDAEGGVAYHYYPYTKKGKVVAYKERILPKTFKVHGDFKDVELFGQAQASGSKTIIITEGELDAMSVAQAQYDKYKKFYPVVSLASASQVTTLVHQKEFLRGFQEIILCFDMDDPGQEAAKKAAKIIGYDKVKICILPEKDASDVYTKHGGDTLLQSIFNARSYSPAGVIRGESIWEQYKQRKATISVPYPKCLGGLNMRLKGMRMGDIVLFTSGTGSGKSTVIKEIVLNILETTGDMVGMVSLEESVGETTQKFLAMQLQVSMEDMETIDEASERKAFEKVFGDERLVLLDHQGSVSDDSLLDKIEHLCLLGCKYIILDHITIAVSEGADDKTGNEAVDYVMSSLLKIVKKHNVWLGVISHLRKGNNQQKPFEEGRIPSMDDIKGSGSIKQISMDIVGFARNMIAEDDNEKNTIKFRVLKARFTGNTGNAGQVRYNPKTSRIKAIEQNDFEYA